MLILSHVEPWALRVFTVVNLTTSGLNVGQRLGIGWSEIRVKSKAQTNQISIRDSVALEPTKGGERPIVFHSACLMEIL